MRTLQYSPAVWCYQAIESQLLDESNPPNVDPALWQRLQVPSYSISSTPTQPIVCTSYAMSCTVVEYRTTTRYALSGKDVGYGTTPATPCPVLT